MASHTCYLSALGLFLAALLAGLHWRLLESRLASLPCADKRGQAVQRPLGGAEGSDARLQASAQAESALVMWPTVPVPTLKGSDVRILQTITVLLKQGFVVDVGYYEEIEDELQREGVLGVDSSPHFALLHELGVRRIIGPLSTGGLRRTAITGYSLLVYWLWPNPDYLQCLIETSRFVKQANGMATVVAACDDAGLAFRSLVGAMPQQPKEVLRKAILYSRPPELVGNDALPDAHGLPEVPPIIRQILRYEMEVYCCFADILVGISPAVTDIMHAMVPGKPTVVLPYAMQVPPSDVQRPGFSERSDYAFFGYTNAANNAGMEWFVRHVLPLLEGPHKLHVLGSVKTSACTCAGKACQSNHPRILCHGAVSDAQLDRVIGSVRATINPALEPAGVATKTLRSLGLGTPVVSTEYDGTFTPGQAHVSARLCKASDAACFARELAVLLGDAEVWRAAASAGPGFVNRAFTMDAFSRGWSQILQLRQAKPLDVVIQGEARREGESMQAQLWHLARTLSGDRSLRVAVIGGVNPPMRLVRAVPVTEAPFPTGFQASVIIRQNWPPILEAPPLRYCGPGCRVATILPWEFGSLPKMWVAPLQHFADQLWAPSEYNRQVYVSSGIDESRTATLPCGIDCEALDAAAKQPKTPNGVLTFMFSGGLLPRKGVDVLIAAWQRAFCRSGAGFKTVRLLLHTSYELGYNAEEINRIERVIKFCGNIEWMRGKWLDRREYLKMMRDADVYVSPFRSEGFGLPLVEAMALGLPVITTVGGTAADDYFDVAVGYPVGAKHEPCVHSPCNSKGHLCVFMPCDQSHGCSCEELVHPATYFEPAEDTLTEQLLHVLSSFCRDSESKVKAAQHYVRPLYCWTNQQARYVDQVHLLAQSRSERWSEQRHSALVLEQGTGPGSYGSRPGLRSDEARPFLRRGPYEAWLQGDGNFVVYKHHDKVLFATGTIKECPCTLVLEPCSLRLKDRRGRQYYAVLGRCKKAWGQHYALALEADGSLAMKQGTSSVVDAMTTVHLFDWSVDGLAQRR